MDNCSVLCLRTALVYCKDALLGIDGFCLLLFPTLKEENDRVDIFEMLIRKRDTFANISLGMKC